MRPEIYQGRLLIVENDADNASLERDMLEEAGFQNIALVSSAEDAQEVLNDAPQLYNLIILDLDLPGTHGLEYLRELKSQGSSYQDVPVIVITSTDSQEMKDACRRFGASDFISKPFEMGDLLQKVKDLVDDHGTHR